MFQMFERETRREKILDARHREMKIKERAKSSADGGKQVKFYWLYQLIEVKGMQQVLFSV